LINIVLRGCSAALAALSLCLSQPARAQEPAGAPLQWIDVHVHPVGGIGQDADYRSAVDDLLSTMKANNMARAIVMPTPQGDAGSRGSWDIEDFMDLARKHPDRLAYMGGGGTLNKMIHMDSPDGRVSDDLRARFKKRAEEILAKGAIGFGEMSILHISLLPGHTFESVAGDHPLWLLLADIAAERNVPIDVHFDPVAKDLKTAEWLSQPPNPPVFKRNLDGFERLLAHNRKAVIVWAHAGSDNLGQWTAGLTRAMLRKHPNLYMSLRLNVGRGGHAANNPLAAEGLKPHWMEVFKEFPDRFVIGGDQFFVPQSNRGFVNKFAQAAAAIRKRTNVFLSRLPPEIARKIAYENAIRIYKLKP
jgi:hypothetical protein